MSEFLFGKEVLDKVMTETENIIEMLFSGQLVTSTTYAKAQGESVKAGYEGLVVSLAVDNNSAIIAYIKRDEKQYYENGLNCAGLSNVAQANGVGDEVPLLIRIKEKGTWELGFKAAAATPTVNYRIRVRYIRK